MSAPTPLTDLATCKAWLGIPSGTTTSDAILNNLIAAVSGQAASYCNRNFGSASYTETYDGNGMSRQWLNQRPVSAVSSVMVNGVARTQRPANDVGGCGWTFNKNEIYLAGMVFNRGYQNVTIAYTAGYVISESLTPDLWQACTEWVALLYKGKDRIGKSSEAIATNSTTFLVKELPIAIKGVLDRYKQVSPVAPLGI